MSLNMEYVLMLKINLLWPFLSSQSKPTKAIDKVRVILNSLNLCLRKVYGVFSLMYSRHLTIWGLAFVKNKSTSVFYASINEDTTANVYFHLC